MHCSIEIKLLSVVCHFFFYSVILYEIALPIGCSHKLRVLYMQCINIVVLPALTLEMS